MTQHNTLITAKRLAAAALSFIFIMAGASFSPGKNSTVHALTPVVKQVTLSVSKITEPESGWGKEFTGTGSFAFAKDTDVDCTSAIHVVGFSKHVNEPDKWKAAVVSSTSTTVPTLSIPASAKCGENYTIETSFRTSIAYDQMSAIIYNSAANDVVAYGKIGDVESGSVKFKMPTGISKGRYTLWVFLEKFNDDKADQIYTIGKRSFSIQENSTVEKHDVTIDFSSPIKLLSGETTQINLTGQMSPIIVTLTDTEKYYFPEKYMTDKSPIDGITIEYLAPTRVRIYGTPQRINTFVELDPPSMRETETISEKYSVKILNMEDAESKGHMIHVASTGGTEQNEISGMMKTIVFKADNGYYFDSNDYVTKSKNGVYITRAAIDEVRISGVPSANVVLTMLTDIPAAKPKITPDIPANVTADTLKLVGTTKSMEYADANDPDHWYTCIGGETTVTPGLKYVRYKATDTSYSGKILTLNVPAGQSIEDKNSGSNGSSDNSDASSNGSNSSSGNSDAGSNSSSGNSDAGSNGSNGSSGNSDAGSNGSNGSSGNSDAGSNGSNGSSGNSDAGSNGSNGSSGNPNTCSNSSSGNSDNANIDNNADNTEYGYTVTIKNPVGTHITIWSQTEDYYHQTNVTGKMKDTSYFADAGYYFPTDYSIAPKNGVKVIRNGAAKITVYGTPTKDTTITLIPASPITNDFTTEAVDNHSNISADNTIHTNSVTTVNPQNNSVVNNNTPDITHNNIDHNLPSDTNNANGTTLNDVQENVTNLKPVKNRVTIKKGRAKKIKLKITPTTSTQSNTLTSLTYKSSNKKIATVNSKGKVKGVNRGKCIITVTAPSGVSTKIKIKVK